MRHVSQSLECLFGPSSGFPNEHSWRSGLITQCCGDCPILSWVFSTIPDTCPLDVLLLSAQTPPLSATTPDVSRPDQMCLLGLTCLSRRTLWFSVCPWYPRSTLEGVGCSSKRRFCGSIIWGEIYFQTARIARALIRLWSMNLPVKRIQRVSRCLTS